MMDDYQMYLEGMNEDKMKTMMVNIVSSTCDELTNAELAVLNIVAMLDQSPHNRLFDYKKVKSLFTENDGTRMHEETKSALVAIVNSRLF